MLVSSALQEAGAAMLSCDRSGTTVQQLPFGAVWGFFKSSPEITTGINATQF
jgi:hypothetical protein